MDTDAFERAVFFFKTLELSFRYRYLNLDEYLSSANNETHEFEIPVQEGHCLAVLCIQ